MSFNRRKTRAPAPPLPPPHVANNTPAPIMLHDHRHDLLVRFFTHHDRPADTPEQRAVTLGAWLDAAVAAIPEPGPDDVIIAATPDTPSSRRKSVRVVAAVPDVGPVTCVIDVLRPSGRFDALVDMGNPMKGINLFPYLRRPQDGRALRALGPAASLELSRTVCEAALPRRWPREVLFAFEVCFPVSFFYTISFPYLELQSSGFLFLFLFSSSSISFSSLSLSLSLSLRMLAALEIGANEDVSLEVWRGHS